MKLTGAFLAACLFGVAGCASTGPEDGETIVADANPDGIICEKVPEKGSRLGKTVCTSRAEREAAAEITREEVRNKERLNPGTNSVQPAGMGN